jgi:hypothetical protein
MGLRVVVFVCNASADYALHFIVGAFFGVFRLYRPYCINGFAYFLFGRVENNRIGFYNNSSKESGGVSPAAEL